MLVFHDFFYLDKKMKKKRYFILGAIMFQVENVCEMVAKFK